MSPPQIAVASEVMRTTGWADYALLDSGHGRKLEQYGPYKVVRPEPQCLWSPRLPQDVWDAADAVFDPSDEEDAGRWRFKAGPVESWPLGWGDVKFHGRFTAFRHLAFFPEQAANWGWLDTQVRSMGPNADGGPARVLNLFGYTGVASLVMAAAGAAVTHVDASKKAVAWARENAELSRLSDRPVRWIVEDAKKYVQREVRRGSTYEGIILDPPKYGRGPDGQVWRLFEDLPEMASLCAQLLSADAKFLVLNAYAERISGAALAGLLAEKLEARGGRIEWGELALEEQRGDRAIGMSFFARWSR
ncbi:MAG: class I SAM-dependent methyltransferase [Alphaproteobacteria bacterium]|nr:class I SAM-dependent methyltransferase [Alphaproteobacteria bacterium]MBU1512881.1 class I SAM-dependent methyltransferase [Alphaproteobacteria bacterium]MBU2096678.1 class I SAM-dependent methyltransferase [Alphaproteobacteria bacterium]MBU2150561.1 class I SAM-dependent methyltransferase [Alphaproteobacteria bacterium]MBU2308059.1 class I SAM-dependent methyltransferase [Alphaproteobacteria bacterium]